MYKPTTEEDHLALVIADVSGKGIPASLFMMSSKILINDQALMGGTPAEILARVNKQVSAGNDANMFVAINPPDHQYQRQIRAAERQARSGDRSDADGKIQKH